MGNSNSNKKQVKLTNSQVKFLSERTELTESAIRKIFNKFVVKNTSTSGKLNENDFVQLYCSFRNEPEDKVKPIAKLAFEAFDKDKNGSIDYEEFILSFALTSRGTLTDKLGFTFHLYDKDNNGYLTLAEVKRVIEPMLGLLDAERKCESLSALSAECMKVLDTSKDGKISKEEFVNGLTENYSLRSLMSPFN